MENSILIRGGRVIDPKNGIDQIADVLVMDGKIDKIGENLSAEGVKVLEAEGRVVAPGFIDMHCHLRDPGQVLSQAVSLLHCRQNRDRMRSCEWDIHIAPTHSWQL